MKYMGSKREMLRNGLGCLLERESETAERVVDLFAGSGSVAWFAANQLGKRVLAADLQAFAAVLSAAVVERTVALNPQTVISEWLARVAKIRQNRKHWHTAATLDDARVNTTTWVRRARELCGMVSRQCRITRAYGGHYFSPTQALTLDTMLACLPAESHARNVCLAASIVSASECAASPGHTAQPFQPTRTAACFLREAWLRDPLLYAGRAVELLCPMRAKVRGKAVVADALAVASTLREGDLVFVDPPYSDVQYSRFYHVLETVARGVCGPVAGTGRYPPAAERPVSPFSRRSESLRALSILIDRLAKAKCTAIVTFPKTNCSNGLSGDMIVELAKKHFRIEQKIVCGRFSTLGGNNSVRKSRTRSREMILLLCPR
jgi:adenine-specific DNA methylase